MAIFGKNKDENKKKTTKATTSDAPLKTVKNSSHKVLDWIIIKPLVTEKSMRLSEDKSYVFVVDPSANKSEIRKQIENLYNVDVVKITTTSYKTKPRHFKGVRSNQKKFKKATITVKDGQKIELFNK